MKKRFLLLPTIITATALTPLISCGKTKINLDVVKSNYYKIVMETTPIDDYEDKTAEEILTHLIPVKRQGLLDKEYDQYQFDDVDYVNNDPAIWGCHTHILRALHIAVAAIKHNDAAKLDIAIKLTYWWLADNRWNPNWWFNTIGVPRDIGSIGILLYDKLTPAGQNRILEMVHRGSFKYTPSTLTYTGANLFWFADITLKCALLEKDNDTIRLMIDRVIEEIKEDDNEGFQHDGTFFQHGRQVYNGGYGRQAATLLAKIISSFANSGYQWPEDKLEILANYIVQGIGCCTHKGQFSYLTMGRTYTRKTAGYVDGRGTDLGNVFEFKYLLDIENFPYKNEIHSILEALEHKDKANFTGIKCFPMSHMISMNVGDDVFMSFRGINNRLINSETANYENILGHNLAYGATTCVMSTGDEYNDISPVWDYAHIPGTTSIYETDEVLGTYGDDDFKSPTESEGPYFCGETDGVAFSMQKAYHYYKDGATGKNKLNYTITCFGTPNGMVLLGDGIQFEQETNKTLTTTVEQCIAPNNVDSTDKYVINGNVVYKNIDDLPTTKFVTTHEDVTGKWSRNNETYLPQLGQEEETVTKKILTISIESETPSRYAYSIQPSSKQSFEFKVASNTTKIQAIDIGNDKIAVACYEPDTFYYEGMPYEIKKAGYSVIEKKA